ncbi:MAG: undecaprenyldiphospho-muramoylpentapeptide beta-N-acetylglucosaminyltransferase [Balneolaceae bacterium]|nr:undecaprenyldiphospho-muramoylpentapeptide beta-N-acetylglucosaminyltransferase [Balneolaceae bacterium]
MHSAATDISSTGRPSSAAVSSPRVLIAAGGTGGHVYPAIAIADALQEECPDTEILFAGTKDHMEWHAVPDAGYDIRSIWISGFHRRLTLKNLLFPAKLSVSLVQSYSLVGTFNPDIVVSCGGYVAGPVGWVAARRGVPLVVQEQNSYPGVTNRILGRSAEMIFTAFEDANRYFPTGKTVVTGNPTRKALTTVDNEEAYRAFEFTPHQQTLLVLGGSGGARSINEAMIANIQHLHDELQLQVIWQCGPSYYDKYRNEAEQMELPNLRLQSYIRNMDQAYAAADLVVSRAGALSCSELALTGTPSILVPSPNVAGDHQTRNARSMADTGAAILVKDSNLKHSIVETVEQVLGNPDQLETMRRAARALAKPDAANMIATEILKITESKHTE